MASSSPSSDSSPLLEHLETLYLLASTLVGPRDAPSLLRRTAEEAAKKASTDRPTELDDWRRALLRTAETHEELTKTDSSAPPPDAAEAPDPWRRDAAEQIIEDTLPIAFAHCTPRERFHLAVEGLIRTEASDDDTDARPSGTRAPLWSTLEELLSDPEYVLVRESLSEEALQDAIRGFLATRHPSPPRSLRSQLQDTLASSSPSQTESSTKESEGLLNRMPFRPKPRALLFTLLLGMLVLAGGIGISYYTGFSSASSSPSQSLVAFSASHAGSMTPSLETSSRVEGTAYVDSVWDRRLTIPQIRGATFEGVSRLRTPAGADVPVFIHTDDSTRFTTFAYSYALLDQLESEATLGREVRTALSQAHQVVGSDHAQSEQGVLWRDRDDIFVTVAPTLPTDSLRARLRPQR